jgi:predicted ATP-dependent serine protease
MSTIAMCTACGANPPAVLGLCIVCERERLAAECVREQAQEQARREAHRWRGRPPARYASQDAAGHGHGSRYLRTRQQVLHDRPD